ncbi:hypothetical protein ACF07D_03080 [Leucobacter sp. NPDC015123]|uniref:hypothetical protein n=1 Tax=Leucobacter sp. NPDC015123 TaxID=3364129 RepID=UPI0036F4A7A0
MKSRTREPRTGKVRVLIAAGALLGVGAAVTAAAYLDQATVKFSASGGTYDIAFADADGNTHQGNPEPYELDASDLPPINEVGSEPLHRTELVLRNAGTTDSGTLSLTLTSMLPQPPPDDDGVRRDPFDILLVTAWNTEGVRVADAIPVADLVMTLDAWPAGEDRTVALQFAYPSGLGTPYYFGKDTRIGFHVEGVSG